ncbi:50S ribosomal protein L4 [Erysipelotrichaceae bacterium Oil+RF-744-GAM-WT-6]|jgi:large subunit ribosomal protein L4|uniref:Large ribosomal subunit protein uL4 n=1 Tax=Stecheria intestinalis TaxID=2606630 RepID=A0A7X2NS20_9FIRM|nr:MULTISPECIES: 50S ribosomal protein L4 [Erysipelotrichaceae]MCI2153591.1 50S ribosomal protein L4 [Solobacterium sp.]MDY3232972.1 50S ribosomal protein L4 [Erysipelotrichaceae bacterium]MDY4681317.1 50S ribosomal protein L4 [Lachnospiraceae bacterium]MCI6745924.1 50S ribosomal protein L4 [Anaerolactibacter massiliensis]MDD5881580.1 50S ribosomal protein L4 [Stecheria intestinalis]
MSKIDVYNQEAKVVKSMELSDAVFGIEPNQQAIYDSVLAYQAGLRQGTHSTKTRHFVSGSGKKPFRQKGTGRARQGSTRATQWRHGAIAFGPHPRTYSIKLNRKVRRLALKSALSEKVKESSLTVVENLSFDEIKTKKAVALLGAFGFDRKTLLVADASEDYDNAFMSFRNIPNALVISVSDLNVYDIVNADKIVFTEKAAETAGEVLA